MIASFAGHKAVGRVETDYLVVGAGTAGLAFADALIADSDADVVLVDRRHRPGGHWNDAYPFVRLHQPSAFYGVNSRMLGSDSIDQAGPNASMYERATAAQICDYYQRVLDEHLLASGHVRFFGMCDCHVPVRHRERVRTREPAANRQRRAPRTSRAYRHRPGHARSGVDPGRGRARLRGLLGRRPADGARPPGFRTRPRITLQAIRSCQPAFSAALAGYLEATRADDASKNRLCPPNPYPGTAADWIPTTCISLRAQDEWLRDPDVAAWLDRSRLNAARGIRDHLTEPRVKTALNRLFANTAQAIANLDTFQAQARRAAVVPGS